MKKGFVFTLFAFLIIAILILTISVRPEVAILKDKTVKIVSDELFYFLKSLESDLSRTTDISGRRALVALVDISLKKINTSNSDSLLEELFFNGTYNDQDSAIMDNSSIQYWQQKTNELSISKYTLTTSFISFKTEFKDFLIHFNYSYNFSIENPSSSIKFNSVSNLSRKINISDLEDPLVFLNTNGLVSNSFKQCEEKLHASLITSGTQTNIDSWVYGTSLKITAEDPSTLPKNRIAVVDQLCSYSDENLSELGQFDAIVSEEEINLSDPCSGRISLGDFIGGVDFDSVPNNTYLVLNQMDIWENNILEQVNTGCYFVDNQGPSFFDRIENRTTNNKFQGLGHFVNLEEFPQEIRYPNSALDYVYFNASGYGPTKKIKGVSDVKSWFLLDQSHIDSWSIEDLSY